MCCEKEVEGKPHGSRSEERLHELRGRKVKCGTRGRGKPTVEDEGDEQPRLQGFYGREAVCRDLGGLDLDTIQCCGGG